MLYEYNTTWIKHCFQAAICFELSWGCSKILFPDGVYAHWKHKRTVHSSAKGHTGECYIIICWNFIRDLLSRNTALNCCITFAESCQCNCCQMVNCIGLQSKSSSWYHHNELCSFKVCATHRTPPVFLSAWNFIQVLIDDLISFSDVDAVTLLMK